MSDARQRFLPVRVLLFSILVPGVVAGCVPWVLWRTFPADFDPGWLRFAGMLVMGCGIGFYVISAVAFLREGRGTPAIYFTRPLRGLIGEEPGTLVAGLLYSTTRNPMYLAVIQFVLGAGIVTGRWAILAYFILLSIFFHCVVVLIEEPHLRKTFGTSYEAYTKRVPRWFRFLP